MKTNKTFAYGFLTVIIALAFIACPADNNSNPQPKTYTVTFNADNGSEPTTQTVTEGSTANKPADPSKTYTPIGLYAGTPPTACTFVEWQKPDGSAWNFTTDIVTANITLTAQWTVPTLIDLTDETGNNIVEKAVSYVNTNGGSEYTLVLGEDVSNVAPQTLNQDDTTLTITSDGNIERKISLGNTNGSLFIVGGSTTNEPHSAKLVIDGYITLEGRTDNNTRLLFVRNGGSLDLKGNAKITGNTANDAGGIFANGVSGTGEVIITMSGNAEISGNSATAGYADTSGGVYLINFVTFIMNENAAIKNNNGGNYGGGVIIAGNSTFIMNGGEISHNTGEMNGGVYLSGEVGGGILTVASEQVKAGIHSNSATLNNYAQFAQVWVNDISCTFTVGGEPAESF